MSKRAKKSAIWRSHIASTIEPCRNPVFEHKKWLPAHCTGVPDGSSICIFCHGSIFSPPVLGKQAYPRHQGLLQSLKSLGFCHFDVFSDLEAPPSELCELCRRRLLPSTSSSGSNTDSTDTASHKRWIGDVSKPMIPSELVDEAPFTSWSTYWPEVPCFLMEIYRKRPIFHGKNHGRC